MFSEIRRAARLATVALLAAAVLVPTAGAGRWWGSAAPAAHCCPAEHATYRHLPPVLRGAKPDKRLAGSRRSLARSDGARSRLRGVPVGGRRHRLCCRLQQGSWRSSSSSEPAVGYEFAT